MQILHYLASDAWSLTGTMSEKRFRPACDHSEEHGLVLSGGLYSFVDSVEYTADGAAFDQSGAIATMPADASKYLNCLVALDNGNLFITGMAFLLLYRLMVDFHMLYFLVMR